MFLIKGKALYELRNKQQEERKKPFKHQDDEYYYIIHPDHIRKYLKLQCPNCPPNGSSGRNANGGGNKGGNNNGNGNGGHNGNHDSKKKSSNGDAYGNVNERKMIIYHDVDKSEPFPHELKVVHEFANISSSNANERKTTDSDSTNGKSSFSSSNEKFLAFNSQGANTNGISPFGGLEEKNSNALASFFSRHNSPLFKSKKDEMRFEESQNPANINNMNYLSNSNVATYIGKQSAPPATEKSNSGSSDENSGSGDYSLRKPMVLNVDQKRIDKIFKDNGNTARYNAYPSPDNYLPRSTEHSGLPGNFVLDKNINRNKDTPEYILMPEENAYTPEIRKGPGQSNSVFPSRFMERGESFENSRFSEKSAEQQKIQLPSDQIANSFSPVILSIFIILGFQWKLRYQC